MQVGLAVDGFDHLLDHAARIGGGEIAFTGVTDGGGRGEHRDGHAAGLLAGTSALRGRVWAAAGSERPRARAAAAEVRSAASGDVTRPARAGSVAAEAARTLGGLATAAAVRDVGRAEAHARVRAGAGLAAVVLGR